MSQLPPPPAAGWLLDLGDVRGPRCVVLRRDEAQARAALVEQLLVSGVVDGVEDGAELIAEAIIEPVEVIW